MQMNQFLVWVALWAAGALIVSGVLQGIKGSLPNLPTLVYKLLAPAISVAVALFAPNDAPIWNALGIYAVSQLLYDVIIARARREIEGTVPVTPKEQ
jgi:hypothetical protein